MDKLLNNKKDIKQWIVLIGVPLVIMLIPTQGAFTPELRLFLAGTICAILMFAFETLPLMISALLLPIFYIITKLAVPEVVFSPWLGTVPWMFIGGYLLANILIRIGLINRIAYNVVKRTGGTYRGILLGIMVSGIIINFVLPGKAIIPFAALTYGICNALNYGKSKESAGIMITGFLSSFIPILFIFNTSFAVIPNMAASITDPTVTYLEYLFHNWPYVFLLVILVFVIDKMCKPKEGEVSIKEFAEVELAKLGKFSLDEKKALLVSFLLFLFMVTADLHKINIAWGYVIAGCIFYLPGFNVGVKEDITKVDFSMIIFTSTCLSIGAVANALGLGKVIAELVLPLLSSSSTTIVLATMFIICIIANFPLTPMAIYATFTLALTTIGMKMGIDPKVIFYTINAGSAEILFPYQWALPLFYVSFGLIPSKEFTKIWGIKMLIGFIFFIVIMCPYWKLIGLI